MLRRVNRDHAFAAVCAENGAVTEILSDTNRFFENTEDLPDLAGMMQDACRAAYLKFVEKALSRGHSMHKEIVLLRDDREFAFFLFGIARNDRVFVLAVQSPQQIFLIYDEFMAMINEQARELREVQKKSVQYVRERASTADTKLLEDYMQLNNELANMQRELSITNLELQNQEKRFRDLVTFNPDAQIVLGANGHILFFNPAAQKILGLSQTDSIGSVFPLDLTLEKEFCLRSGQRRTCVEIRQTSVVWENEPATLISLRDITERKQIEQMRDDVDRILQHDLISPLNPIISLPQLLIENPALSEDQKQILKMISKAGNRMLDMVRLSLNLYKMEQGTFTFVPQPVNLLSTFRDIVADLSERVRSKKVFVHMVLNDAVALPRDTFWVMAEPTLCYSLFSNLTLNAIEASPANGIVSIFLDQGSQAQIRVHNLGAVPVDIRSRFFEKYVTSGKTQGTGLGTYSARLLATTMGGKIEMQTAEESGTTLTVFLVSAKDTALVHQSPSLKQNTDAAQPPIREEEQLPAGDQLRNTYELLVQDLELNSLARAKKIHAQLKDGSSNKKMFSLIIEPLMRFDFEKAKSILRNISSRLEL
jgi:signal transduction histidine kinase